MSVIVNACTIEKDARSSHIQSDRVGIVIQARMGSTRLPGKVLMPIGGVPMLSLIMNRFQELLPECHLIVATTSEKEDDPLVAAVAQHTHASLYRGASLDVLDRYYQTCKIFSLSTCIRITSDCPFVNPLLIRLGLSRYQHSEEGESDLAYNYLSNTLRRTFPRGLDFEIFSFSTLEAAYQESTDPYEREHVTPFIYRNADRFRCCSFEVNPSSLPSDFVDWRLTVDQYEDLQLASTIANEMLLLHKDENRAKSVLYTSGLNDLLAIMNLYPEWKNINKHVLQKP